ncbi:MAG: 50S ribosomal protein L14e [Candidatus Micrarchaeota archaeon]|nr:50S ribosomal protein L14e [Candidatus Micrarchaeota archaeon]
MSSIQVGRKCIKTKGRKAGQTVTITKLIDRNLVEITDSKGKAKKCNVMHLEPI